MNQLEQALELLLASINEVRRKDLFSMNLWGSERPTLSEIAGKYQSSFGAVFWIDGSTKEKLRQSITNFANRIPQDQIPKRGKSSSWKWSFNVDEAVSQVLKWLSQPSNNQCLLIIINVDREVSASFRDPESFDVNFFFQRQIMNIFLSLLDSQVYGG